MLPHRRLGAVTIKQGDAGLETFYPVEELGLQPRVWVCGTETHECCRHRQRRLQVKRTLRVPVRISLGAGPACLDRAPELAYEDPKLGDRKARSFKALDVVPWASLQDAFKAWITARSLCSGSGQEALACRRRSGGQQSGSTRQSETVAMAGSSCLRI